MDEELDKRVQNAVEYFMKGYGCCQSVVAAFADIYGLREEQALRIGAGFGGGVGRMRMMCGCVSGLVTLAGLAYGQTDGSDRKGKAECYRIVQELVERFRQDNGSIICAELLGLEGKVTAGDYTPSERNVEYYKARPCAAKVKSAARIFAEKISTDKKI